MSSALLVVWQDAPVLPILLFFIVNHAYTVMINSTITVKWEFNLLICLFFFFINNGFSLYFWSFLVVTFVNPMVHFATEEILAPEMAFCTDIFIIVFLLFFFSRQFTDLWPYWSLLFHVPSYAFSSTCFLIVVWCINLIVNFLLLYVINGFSRSVSTASYSAGGFSMLHSMKSSSDMHDINSTSFI